MAVVYLDSSALVKLVVDEDGSDLAAAVWDGADAVVSSRLAGPEVRAALAAAHRGHRLDDAGWTSAAGEWARLAGGLRMVELTSEVAEHAGDLAVEHGLRGADAVHLASALVVASPELVVAVWDARLAVGARAAGLRVVP
ncbi:type II toxin-antitoxin system VapC family toxin [uncultured Pseudokineococcus sp.]|uniref:type II toxin-antitoxin system VapC family toxin n=1 Tax=uncultured Pseudokineococcus sp. TaxID=1642928 RepID=UPI0026074EC4|nr:type II toxin-antitoxin system VapC family toxin [uncultured Pseudokineococcus sp.]